MLNRYLWKDTLRCVVQPRSIDSISIVVNINDYDYVVAFVLGVTSNISTIDYLKFFSLDSNIPQNESEAFDRFIISFLMTTLINIKDDKIRSCKRVTFG